MEEFGIFNGSTSMRGIFGAATIQRSVKSAHLQFSEASIRQRIGLGKFFVIEKDNHQGFQFPYGINMLLHWRESPKTNNAVEGWHRAFSALLSSHPLYLEIFRCSTVRTIVNQSKN
ncbi:uncharacterized protein LOC135930095 [Gordionus sp. m RMFG-2023]|uniref:uncharacterized protein LOC135930095 n=1 Tax=Gordionus sp. m RMFG-2023 TaxID=3053472 RepID=UPI0031FCEC47